MSKVHAGGPAADGAVQGVEQENSRAGRGAVRNRKRSGGISKRDVKDVAGWRARGGTSWRRRNGDHQSEFLACSVIECGLPCPVVADPKRDATGSSQDPGIDQGRVSGVRDEVGARVLCECQRGKKKERKGESC